MKQTRIRTARTKINVNEKKCWQVSTWVRKQTRTFEENSAQKRICEFRNVYVICNVSRIVSVMINLRFYSPGFFVCLLCCLLRDKYLISRVLPKRELAETKLNRPKYYVYNKFVYIIVTNIKCIVIKKNNQMQVRALRVRLPAGSNISWSDLSIFKLYFVQGNT